MDVTNPFEHYQTFTYTQNGSYCLLPFSDNSLLINLDITDDHNKSLIEIIDSVENIYRDASIEHKDVNDIVVSNFYDTHIGKIIKENRLLDNTISIKHLISAFNNYNYDIFKDVEVDGNNKIVFITESHLYKLDMKGLRVETNKGYNNILSAIEKI